MDIDTEELKQFAPIIPYVKEHYSHLLEFDDTKDKPHVCFAKCLWHEENTASLAFFSNGTYKCFGDCGEHGDVITFVQKVENVSFQEACKMIGDNVGYDVILEEPNPLFEAYKDQLDNHTRRYWSNLQQNGEALRYLICERGITKEMIDLFRLGFTDAEEFKYRTDIGGISNKIVFPILEHKRKRPKCVGMAYRGLTDEKPKYINDANQDGREGQNPNLAGVFVKGNLLYGLPMAYEAISKNGHLILVEGYFDVISMHQSGICNTVAAMGTAITSNQIKEMAKITKNVILCLDGDKAGTQAMFNVIKDMYKEGINVAVCVLDNGMDPDELCKHLKYDGNAIYRTIRSHSKQGIEFIVNREVERYENIAMQERTKALAMAMPIIESVQSPEIRDLYKSRLYKRLDI